MKFKILLALISVTSYQSQQFYFPKTAVTVSLALENKDLNRPYNIIFHSKK